MKEVKTTNILFNDRVRKKKKSFWENFTLSWYYENEKIPMKEKVYTFYYNLQRTGLTTKGEMDWSMRMMELDYKGWNLIKDQFNEDYKEFINHAN